MRANESGPERESREPHVAEPQPGGDPTPSREPFRSRLRKGVVAAVAVGGVLGGLARYVLGLTFPTPRGTFPLTTFAINASTCPVRSCWRCCSCTYSTSTCSTDARACSRAARG
jgi:CrcB protein